MRFSFKIFLSIFAILCFQFSPTFAQNQSMTPDQMHLWIQEALHYGFDMKTTDYTKYMSTDYVEHIDGKVFNFKQWLHHMNGLKDLMQSYTLTFDEIVAEGEQIATSYVVHATKKDGSKLDIRIIAIFKIKDGKIIYCDELTHVINGNQGDKEIGSRD
jgi:hypothetical protein